MPFQVLNFKVSDLTECSMLPNLMWAYNFAVLSFRT